MVALADAGSRIRLALRNPLDEETTPRHSLTLAALFSGSSKPGADGPDAAHPASAVLWDHPVQLHVRVLEASDAALEELQSQLAAGYVRSVRQVHPISHGEWLPSAPATRPRKLVHSLEQKHELEVVSGERLMAGVGRPISYARAPSLTSYACSSRRNGCPPASSACE